MSDKKTILNVLKNLLNAGEGNESSNAVGQHLAASINQKLKQLKERDAKEKENQKKD